MRDRDQRLRNEVEHPERYEEVTITSCGVPIVLSVWHGQSGGPVAVFLPGTMTHPLFYEEFWPSPEAWCRSSLDRVILRGAV